MLWYCFPWQYLLFFSVVLRRVAFSEQICIIFDIFCKAFEDLRCIFSYFYSLNTPGKFDHLNRGHPVYATLCVYYLKSWADISSVQARENQFEKTSELLCQGIE